MRASLKASLDEWGGDSFRYAKGSLVICNACAVPVAKLDYGLSLGDKAGRMASAFKPLSGADIDALAGRDDVDAGLLAWARTLTPEARKAYLERLHEFRTGDPMLCPTCHGTFVQVLSVERSEVLDKAYVIELVTIPPSNAAPIRGKHLGYYGDWIHEGAKVVH